MAVSSVPRLYLHLVSSAFQRCRESEDLCRLSVALKSSPSSNAPVIQISISDTGIGSCLEEFLDLKSVGDRIAAEKFDGLLSVRTTGITDKVISHYCLNLREADSRRVVNRLPPYPKNGAKFSGTEVSLSFTESICVLEAEISCFFRKMLILKIPNVAIDLVVEQEDIPGSQCETVFLANNDSPLPFSTSNIERLKSGFEEYVLMHGNSLNRKCDTCFPNCEDLKVGIGTACSTESIRGAGLVMEAVIIITELDPTTPCFRECSTKTEVLYFKDFTSCSISQSSVNALTSIDWKHYGLTMGKIIDQGGYFIEWEDLPPHSHIDIVLHCYKKKVKVPSARHKTQPDWSLTKKAVKLALNNLKEKHGGLLLSAHTVKICSYAPELARSIAGLILSTNDPDFQGECFSLLGLQSGELTGETVVDCIKKKITSVIEMNDRKAQKSKEAAPFLFEDGYCQDSCFQDDEHEESEDEFSSFY